jgi:hypothetical protein
MIIYISNLLQWKIFRKTYRENHNAQQGFSKIRGIYEICDKIWYIPTGHRCKYNKSYVYCGIDNKATDTHLDYIIITVFPLQR